MKKDVVCIYSGGMDSFTLVNEAQHEGVLHSCLSFDYGQRHVKELQYAARWCESYGVPHHVIDLRSLTPHLLGSSLTDNVPMPEGHYAEDNMKLTVVPSRNTIMLAVASAYAVSHKLAAVRYGAHAGDHTIYPDCREEYVSAMNTVTLLANWHRVRIEAPYLEMTKVGILERGFELGLDYAQSWTCYKGGELACGKCGSCQERLEAFAHWNEKDPLEYAV